jgi:hypothetical protein
MKTLFSFFLSMLVLGATAQTIRIADNNPNRPTGTNVFATIQAAVNAAAPGDIVYVQPSLTSYGDVTIDRQITLRGIGFNTGKDLAYQSIVNNIALTNTVTNATNASGSTLEGLQANVIFLGVKTGTFTYTLQNITIQNCQLNYVYKDYGGVNQITTNITIKNNVIGAINFIGGGATSQFLIYSNRFFAQGIVFSYQVIVPGTANPCNCGGSFSTSINNYIISNNIFSIGSYIDMGGIGGNFNNTSTTTSAVLVANNVFLGNPTNSNSLGSITDVTFANNIFYGVLPRLNNGTGGMSSYAFGRNVFTNNITFNTSDNTLPPINNGSNTNSGIGNLQNTDPKFSNVPVNSNWLATLDFTLQAGLAKNGGSDGTDIGITGGTYLITAGNFDLKPTSVPVIITFNPTGLVPQNQPVKTNIKAKSN